MAETTKAIIFGSITFIVLFIIYYYVYLKPKWYYYNGKKKSKKNKNDPLNFMEFTYLKNKFKLDINKINVLYILRLIGIIDAFIISLTGTIVYYIPGPLLWKYLVGFAILFALIYSLYEVFGRYLVKKGWSKK